MPCSITLTAVPGHFEDGRAGRCRVLEFGGTTYGRETVEVVSTVPDIRAAVARFGQGLRRDHPTASFQVFVNVNRGHRKPNGFDRASDTNGFGQYEFMATRERTS